MRQSAARSVTKDIPHPGTCGFQISWIDAAVILVCGIATWLVWLWLGQIALLFPVALGHFFLFCNVFRIFRKYEYVWAAVFVLNFLAWLLAGRFSWWGGLAVQTPLTLALILVQMRSPWYHGVGARIVNKEIEAYLQGDLR